ncbi:MAG: hypothetical protein GY765_28265 [bacterium]|nr:hypothetical protein [bacterium]
MLLCRAVAAGTMVVFPRWHILGICASLLVPVLLMAVAYFSVYRKWDPACLPSFGKKFSSRFLIMVGILDAVAVLVLMRNIIF